MRATVRFALLGMLVAAGCTGAPIVEVSAVEQCLDEQFGEDGWAQIPASDVGGTVFGVDLDTNSVLIYVEPDATAVRTEIDAIRDAEEQFGTSDPDDQQILSDRGNVLLAWANPPTTVQRALAERCVGFS